MGGQHLGDQRIHLRLVAYVAAHIQRAQFRSQGLAACIVHIHDHRFGTFNCKPADAGFTNALRATGNDADATCVAKVNGRPEGWGGACRIHGRGW
ncbi:hypothetical protein D3C71_1618470 [compost metagenome]